MNVRVTSQYLPLAQSLGEHLRLQGHTAESLPFPVHEYDLRYGPGVTLGEVGQVMEQIRPLLPTVTADATLTGCDIEIRLGDSKPLSHWEIKLYTSDGMLADRLRGKFGAIGFRDDGTNPEDPDRMRMLYGGCTPFARQCIRFMLGLEGIRVQEKKEWGDDDDDVWLYVKDPAGEGKPARERYGVEVQGDDYEQMSGVKSRLEERGFRNVALRPIDADSGVRFRFTTGPFVKDPAAAEAIREVVEQAMLEAAIDPARYPLEFTEGAGASGVICMPVGAMRSGRLRPYAGAWPERWSIEIHTDDVAGTAAFRSGLTEAGFSNVSVLPLPASSLGFSIRWGAARRVPEVAGPLRERVEALLAATEIRPGYGFVLLDDLPDDDDRVIIDLPLATSRSVSFYDRLRDVVKGHDCAIKTPNPDEIPALADALRALPWKSFSLQSEGDATHEIQYGGAPVGLVGWVRDEVERITGTRLPISKDWGDADDDVWIHLPRPAIRETPTEDGPMDLARWLSIGVEAGPPVSLIEVGRESVRIGRITLPRRDGAERRLVPSPDLFLHYCLDRRTVETLAHVAESVWMGEPCLLEGETSVSKTSIVQYLAMLCDQPVVRLNLNGQTDTGELVGRYVPQDAVSSLPVDADELFAAQDLLEDESRRILHRAAAEGRALTRVEVQQVMANERMTVHPWRWQDGLVVTAMKKGWWLVLDELNLAEPQILERLNPVLELYPSLVLTEHDNQVIGPGGVPVHPNFRVFATMNPAEYAGRSPLSPAWRDRWRGYRYVAPPGEHEYLAMLRFLVFGEQPEVWLDGESFSGDASEPAMGRLAGVDGIDDFLRALARFHTSLEEAVGRRGGSQASKLGGRRREGYVFSRRGLLAVMEYLNRDPGVAGPHAMRSMRRALVRYYLGRVLPGADQRVVASLLDASGIGPTTWAPERLDALAAEPLGSSVGATGSIEPDFDEE